MRLAVVVRIVVACAAVACASAGVARAPDPVTVDLTPRQVSPRVWYVQGDSGMISMQNQGFNSNAGFVVTDEGVVVFDALGTPALGDALLAQIRRITSKPVRRVVVSHYHSDHFYGLQAMVEAGADVWAHRSVRDYLATDAPALRLAERRESLAPWVTDEARIVEPHRYVDGDSSFTLGGVTFHLYAAGPAHTPEDMMMLVEEEGVLFAGDLIFAGRVPFVGDADPRAWLDALDALAGRKPSVVVTGHGPASKDAQSDVSLTRDYLRFLRDEMASAVDEMLTFDEAYAGIDWSRFSALPAFEDANRRNAYNVYLRMQREALQTQ